MFSIFGEIQCVTHECIVFLNMGWKRLVGFLKLKVSFVKEPHKRDDILQKRHIILKSRILVATQ